MAITIGKIIRQSGAKCCSFVRESTVRQALAIGDYVKIISASGQTALAIIEDSRGLAEASVVRYEYDCRIAYNCQPEDWVGCEVYLPEEAELAAFLGASGTQVRFGEVAGRSDHVPVVVNPARITGAHSCVFGASGSGKTTLLGLVIESLLLGSINHQIVILDLNSDFAKLRQHQSKDVVNTTLNKCLPLDLITLKTEQDALSALTMELISRPTVAMNRQEPEQVLDLFGMTGMAACEILFRAIWNRLLKTTKLVSVDACLKLLPMYESQIEKQDLAQLRLMLPSETTRAAAATQLTSLLHRLRQSPVWASSIPDSLAGLEKPDSAKLVQFDLGGIPYPSRAVIAEGVLSLLWRRNEKNRRKTLIVIDEAHNLAPSIVQHPWQKATLEWVNRIAAEGRKYGLFLMLVSQRPGKIHPSTLDSCRNYFVLRLQNQDDIESLSRNTTDISPSLLGQTASLPPYHALVFGAMSPPVLIRVGRRRMM